MIVKELINVCLHSEGHDRTVLTLPGKQLQLLQALRSATKVPFIVVLMSGGPVDLSWAKVSVCGHVLTSPNQSKT